MTLRRASTSSLNTHLWCSLRRSRRERVECGGASSDDAHPELLNEAVELIQLWVQQSSCAFPTFYVPLLSQARTEVFSVSLGEARWTPRCAS